MTPPLAELIKAQRANLPIPPASLFAGHVYIVTGAGHGLGFQCAQHLVRLGAKRVIIAVRSIPAGEKARRDIESETGRKNVVDVWKLDLTSYDSVKNFAAKAIRELERIDGLVENAAIALDTYSVAEGLETSLTVNVVSTFLLALLIFPKMESDATQFSITPHIVILTAGLGFTQEKDFTKLMKESTEVFDNLSIRGKWQLGNNARYSMTKLLEIMALRPLATLLPVSRTNVVINLLHPGLCNTGLARYSSLYNRALVRTANALIGRTAEMGSRTLLHGVTAGRESHGKYLSDCEIKEHHIPDWVNDATGQQWQKKVLEQLMCRLGTIAPSVLSLLPK